MFLWKRLLKQKHQDPQSFKKPQQNQQQILSLKFPIELKDEGFIDDHDDGGKTTRSKKPLSDRTHERKSKVKIGERRDDLGLSSPLSARIPQSSSSSSSQPIEIVSRTPKKISLSKEEVSISGEFSVSRSLSCEQPDEEGLVFPFQFGLHNSPRSPGYKLAMESSAISASYESDHSLSPFDKTMKQGCSPTFKPLASFSCELPAFDEIDYVEFKDISLLPGQKNIYYALMRDVDYGKEFTPVVIKRQVLAPPRSATCNCPPINESNIQRFLSDDIFTEHMGYRHIVPFLNQGLSFETNVHILVMEYCVFGTLLDFVINRPLKAMTSVVRLFIHDVACGLYFMHTMGVAHRDLKLENVMLDYDDQLDRIVAKIGDFGGSSFVFNRTQDPYHIGSPDYSPPELFEKGKMHNPMQDDLWSFGVCLFGAFERKFPYNIDKNADGEIILPPEFKAIKKGTYEFAFAWMSDDDAFMELVQRTLVYDPEKRMSAQGIVTHPFFKKITMKLTPDTF
jgi:hypothetical protein